MSEAVERHELPQPVRLVADAVDAVLAHDLGAARSALGFLDENALRELRAVRRAESRGLPSVSHTAPHRGISRGRQLEVFERDRWRCRYSACGHAPVIDAEVLRLLGSAGLFAYDVPVPGSWHQIAWTYQAVVDHVDPSTDDPARWTTACWACNEAKGSTALDDLPWSWDQLPAQRGWSGLHDQLQNLRVVLRLHRLL